MSSAEMEKSGPRKRILQTAGRLFYNEGYRAVGIDRVIAEADVAKASFYKHFPSKDELIVAWINQSETMSQAILPPLDGPTPLFDYMDAMIDIATQSWCLGCTYQNSAAEFVDPTHPAHAAAIRVKKTVLADLEARARSQQLHQPKVLAEQMFLLLEGVWASVRMLRAEAPLSHAKSAVRSLATAH
jgi:AcrR family transcriptional regulator